MFPPITGNGLVGPWAVAVDGNDNVWVSNLVSDSTGIVQVGSYAGRGRMIL